MKCYVIIHWEDRYEHPIVQKVFLNKKEAHDYTEHKNWEIAKKFCRQRDEAKAKGADVGDWEIDECIEIKEVELF
jgi:hypothetical protein